MNQFGSFSYSGRKGALIVIDGIDGSGKATQVKKIVEALRSQNRRVETMDFPRYEANFFGKLIGRCLRGDYGDFVAINPRIVLPLYALDRFESMPEINRWLSEGAVVVLDRYVSSNQIHQGGKCVTEEERRTFLKWLDEMEHGILGLPRPDLILYLSLPVDVSLRLIQKRRGDSESRAYLEGRKDLAEQNIQHLEAARQSALAIIRELNNWRCIECYDEDTSTLLTIEEVHAELMDVINPFLASITTRKGERWIDGHELEVINQT